MTGLRSGDTLGAARGQLLAQLLREQGQPELGAALSEVPGFATLVALQGEVLARLESALGVAPAQTKHTDPHGVLKLQSLKPGVAVNLFRSYRNAPSPPSTAAPAAATAAAPAPTSAPTGSVSTQLPPLPSPPPLRTMTQIFARYVLPDGTVRVYTKTTASPSDDCPTPQLDVEVGGTEEELIFYVGLGPKAPLSTDTSYLDKYYNQPLPAGGVGRSFGRGGGGDGGTGGAQELPSFKSVEAEARRTEGFMPFVSPSLWVRVLAAGALCFTVKWDGGRDPRVVEAIRRYTTSVVDIWLAHLLADAPAAGGSGGGGAEGPPDPWVVEQWRRAGTALRNHVKHDPLTPMLYPVFGEEQVTKWMETVAGEEVQPES